MGPFFGFNARTIRLCVIVVIVLIGIQVLIAASGQPMVEGWMLSTGPINRPP